MIGLLFFSPLSAPPFSFSSRHGRLCFQSRTLIFRHTRSSTLRHRSSAPTSCHHASLCSVRKPTIPERSTEAFWVQPQKIFPHTECSLLVHFCHIITTIHRLCNLLEWPPIFLCYHEHTIESVYMSLTYTTEYFLCRLSRVPTLPQQARIWLR